MKDKLINIEIDKLTNSIENRITGDNFDTQIVEVTKLDLKYFENNWSFDWKAEFKSERKVFKLIIEENYDVIQGLISLNYRDGFIFVALIESADFNIGRNKVYYGVAGNLFAFACKESWDKGDFGYISFNSKTNLISHYKNFLGAKQVGGSNQMIVEPKEALKLIQQYYKT
ncbi:MAG: hypothetical protein ABR595_06725 [Psychroflexus sp.]